MNADYAAYLQREWEKYLADPSRPLASLAAAPRPGRVLDVGCGAGQELLPFAQAGAGAIGVDVTRESAIVGRRLFERAGHAGRVSFARSGAERLPFASATFDLVICRLALPYTDNRRALREMSRVLKPGGTLLLKIHHAKYYLRKLWHGLRTRSPRSAVHAARVLAAGCLYHLTGRQSRGRLLTGETFQTRRLLTRELQRVGLHITGAMPDSSPEAPALVIGKSADGRPAPVDGGSALVEIQYRLLRRFASPAPARCTGRAYEGRSKIDILLGPAILDRLRHRTVVDFGCGDGDEAIQFARAGASKVIGVDIREECLERARRAAAAAGVAHLCEFTTAAPGHADVIVSIDAFEHFARPAEILEAMDRLLAPGGEVLVSFGPTWLHPLGGHRFSVFPWAHLVLSERALIRWRADFSADGATRFGEVAGGLNQMTIRRFERLVEASPFRFAEFECVPIRRLKRLHNRWTREWTTSVVRCRLVKRASRSRQAA